MMKLRLYLIASILGMLSNSITMAADAPAPPPPAQDVIIEIYRIAPGQHQAFLQMIAKADEANTLAGLPARQLYVHQDGASWDFLLIQPASTPPEKEAALNTAWKKLGLPSGAKFFVQIRQFIAEHSDTFAEGPTTAATWLGKLDK
jgi:hypothetical protein